jgi:beta-galactosidase
MSLSACSTRIISLWELRSVTITWYVKSNEYLIFTNLEQTFGGTNWGNLGHADGYTSYDYGAAITEERQVHREKYSEAKLIANFVAASGDALASATAGFNQTGVFADSTDITVTPLVGKKTKFFVAR